MSKDEIDFAADFTYEPARVPASPPARARPAPQHSARCGGGSCVATCMAAPSCRLCRTAAGDVGAFVLWFTTEFSVRRCGCTALHFGRCALAPHALETGGGGGGKAQRNAQPVALRTAVKAIRASAAGRGRAGVGGSWSRRLDPYACMGLQAAVCSETPVVLSTSPHSTPTHWEVLGPPNTHKRICACAYAHAHAHTHLANTRMRTQTLMCGYAHALARACNPQGSAVLEPRLPRRSKRSLCWRTCAPSPARSTVVSRSQGRSGAIPACVPALSTAWV
jgi:hypothetical protein